MLYAINVWKQKKGDLSADDEGRVNDDDDDDDDHDAIYRNTNPP